MPSYIGNEPLFGDNARNRFTGDGATTTFALSKTPGSPDAILVHVSGVVQDSGSYSTVANNLVFQEAPPAAVPGQPVQNIEVTFLSRTPVPNTGAFVFSGTANGYQRLPSGIIVQWGTTAGITTNSSVVVTFPLAFPANCFSVTANPVGAAISTTPLSLAVSAPSTTQVTIYNWSTVTASAGAKWMAIGN